MFEYEAVLFDLDGTLVDSMGIWKGIDMEYLGKRGIAVPDGLQKAIEGISMYETADYFKERFRIPDRRRTGCGTGCRPGCGFPRSPRKAALSPTRSAPRPAAPAA